MADNKTALGLEVPGQVINSYKELKAAIKAAQDEQVRAASQFGTTSEQYKKATQNVSNLKDQVEDLNDSTKTLKGSGIERSAEGFQQLGQGLKNLDLDKVKTGLNGIRSALAATGIMLIVQGVMYLIENFDKLSKGSGLLAKVLRFVGDIISFVKDSILEFTDAIGITNSKLDKMGENIKAYADKVNEALQQQTKEFDNQIKAAKAAGQSTIELEKAKQEAIIETNKKIVEQIIAFVRAGGQLDEEKKKQLTASLQLIKDARTEEKVIELNHQKEVHENWLKIQEEKNKKQQEINEANKTLKQQIEDQNIKFIKDDDEREREAAALKKERADRSVIESRASEEIKKKRLRQIETEFQMEMAAIDEKSKAAKLKYQEDVDKALEELAAQKNRKIKEQKETDLANENAYIQEALISREENTLAYKLEKLEEEKNAKLANAKLTEEERIAIIKDSNKKETELKEAQRDQNAQIAKQGISAMQGLSDLYFESQLKSAKGNAAKEKEIRRQQFNVNKAFGITNAVIDGVRGVQSALAMGPPAGYVFAALSAVMAGINIAKIASAKFDEGGTSSGGDANMGSIGSAASAAPPNISTPQNTVDTTKFGEGGKNLEMTPPKAQVVETEITSKQKIVTKMEGQAVF